MDRTLDLPKAVISIGRYKGADSQHVAPDKPIIGGKNTTKAPT